MPNTQVTEEAAEWFVDFRTGDVDTSTRAAFSEWLRRGPEYVRAYLEIAAIWHEGATLDAQGEYDTEQLIALARTDENVVELGSVRAQPGRKVARDGAVRRRGLAAAAAVACVAAGAVSWLWWNEGVYRTAIGEQRSITLADGSTVQLNSRSEVRERFSGHERAIELIKGQALFDVAKDAARPFIVESGDTQVRAVGTQFDVYRRAAGTRVTVVEGQVEVRTPAHGGRGPRATESSPATEQTVMLAAGEQATVSAGDTKPARVDVSSATAWTQRRLIFDTAPLEEVAEEFNRYNRRQIILMDANIVDFHISGVFSSTDPGSLIRFLHERSGIEIVEVGDEIRISREGVSTR